MDAKIKNTLGVASALGSLVRTKSMNHHDLKCHTWSEIIACNFCEY